MNTESEANDIQPAAHGNGVVIKLSMTEADAEKFQALLADGTLNEFLDKWGVASVTLDPLVASEGAAYKWTAETDRRRLQNNDPQSRQP